MKKLFVLSIFLPAFLITFAFGMGTVWAETDLTLMDAVVSDPAGTAINPADNVDADGGILDDFNRANGPIGGNWTNQAGTFQVVNNAAQGGEWAIATYNGVTSDAIEADVEYGTTTAVQFTGLVLAYADTSNNYLIKVQDNTYPGSGAFNRVFFYYGNRGTLEKYFDLDSPFTTAHMKVERVGTSVTLTFSEINGGSATQTYSHTYSSNTGGNAIGICGYQSIARLDNFATPGGEVCDYCLTDDFGYKWCLDVIKIDDRAYYLAGTCDTGSTPLKDAIATYLYSTTGLAMTAYGGATGTVFTYNTKFISETKARGVWVNSFSSTGQVDTWLIDCAAAAEAQVAPEGPTPDSQ